MDIRKIIIIFVIAILFSIFVFSVIEAAYPNPLYDDFCDERFYPLEKETSEGCEALEVSTVDKQHCDDQEGYIAYERDSNGCAINSYCETCDSEYRSARDTHSTFVFYISAILALVAIFVGLYLPAQSNTLNEWVGTGFMLGGCFVLFFGTAQGFDALDRFVRPVVLLIELILVIFLAYKKIGNLKKK